VNNPEDEGAGTRQVPFSRDILIEREDFMEDPPKKFFRLAPGREVRLRYAYLITCQKVIRDRAGVITELRCTYDPASRGGTSPDGRKVKATLHWVSLLHGVLAEVRLYDRLFAEDNPATDDNVSPASLEVLTNCYLEPSLKDAAPSIQVQFERLGYFSPAADTLPDSLVFNRIISLRDEWSRLRTKHS